MLGRFAVKGTATGDDLQIAADTPLLVEASAGKALAIVKGEGEAGGHVWCAEVKRV